MNGLKGFVYFCAENDYYGNPQRLYVLSNEDGKFIAAWNEGYNGHHAVPGIWRKEAYQAQRFDISVAKYNTLLRSLPSPDYAHEVEGYSHLRELVNS